MQAGSWDSCHTRRVGDTKTEEPESLLVAPRPTHPQDNWLELIGAGAAGGFTGAVGADAYKGVKAACQAAVKKFRDQPSGPDEEGEYMHQLVAEAFIGPCPPGHKLVHLNGDGLDNRRANLAYVPESDPRPAAPLNPRPPGWPTKTAVTHTGPDGEGELVHQLLPETLVGPYKTVNLKKPRPADAISKTVVTRNAVTRKKKRKGKKKHR
jgi:hypothetical protein